MFKKLASEALGLSDIGKIIHPNDYDKVESDDYILHEENEKIFFLIKSKQDEYCFTNRALIHVDGQSALNKKRLLKRYEYHKYPIHSVLLETAGNIDLDVEIKFSLGTSSRSSSKLLSGNSEKGVAFSIDVDKNQLEQLKDLYKALFEMSLVMSSNFSSYNDAISSLDKSIQLLADSRTSESSKSDELIKTTEYISKYLEEAKEKYVRKDFSEVFLKYIND